MAFVLAALATAVLAAALWPRREAPVVVVCPAPLSSPVTGTPCLYCEHEVVATWRGEGGERELRLLAGSETARFVADGEFGRPERFEVVCTFREQKRRSLHSIATAADLEFGLRRFRVPVGRATAGVQVPPHARIEVVERLVPLAPRRRTLRSLV